MTTCIGIVCIGDAYQKEFEETFKPSVMRYANKHGYDVRIFTDFLDGRDPNAISFQKCLVPGALLEYTRVLVLDADVYISEHAPPLPTPNKLQIVNEVAQVSPEQYRALGWADQPPDYYKKAGFDLKTTRILNTGVILCVPSRDATWLREVYQRYVGNLPHPRGFHYEQACLGYELQMAGNYEVLDNRWNWLAVYGFLADSVGAYFVHFAGIRNRRELRKRWGIHK
jgi:ribosomal protein L34